MKEKKQQQLPPTQKEMQIMALKNLREQIKHTPFALHAQFENDLMLAQNKLSGLLLMFVKNVLIVHGGDPSQCALYKTAELVFEPIVSNIASEVACMYYSLKELRNQCDNVLAAFADELPEESASAPAGSGAMKEVQA